MAMLCDEASPAFRVYAARSTSSAVTRHAAVLPIQSKNPSCHGSGHVGGSTKPWTSADTTATAATAACGERPAARSSETAAKPSALHLVDIGANLLDPMFQGEYREKPRHPADLSAVLSRARDAGVWQIIVTAGRLQEARDALALCQSRIANKNNDWPELFCTVGVHPTRCGEFNDAVEGASEYLASLLAVAHAGREGDNGFCVAVGECGLDYDRLQFCSKEVQLQYLEVQITELAAPLGLPLFLHCRTSEAATDLLELLAKHRALLPSTSPGVVHSFDGSLEDAQRFIEMGFDIGINGCSLKTAQNLEVIQKLPRDRILLETDAPWCAIKPTHAGHGHVRSTWNDVKKPEKWEEGKCVKDRCEPCHLRQVLEVVAGCRGEEIEAFASHVSARTQQVFFPKNCNAIDAAA